MARSDKVPFRREFNVTSNGYIGNEEGFFVGDILSLNIDVVNKKAGLLVQGRVGRSGDWHTIASEGNTTGISNIDIRQYEYVRIEITNVRNSINVILFGYEQNVLQTNIETVATDRDFNINVQIKCLLGEIKEELIKLNLQMAEITGEEYDN
jgi:hypothetical protein